MIKIAPFGLEYADPARFVADEASARNSLDMAVLRREVASLLFALDHVLHSLFVSGEEPGWTSPLQREAVLDARQKMVPLLTRLGLPS